MDKKESAIVPSQAVTLAALGSLGIRLLSLPAEVAQVVGRDGAWVTLAAGLIAMGEVYILAKHMSRFPKMSYPQTLNVIYGKVIGHLINGLFVLLLTAFAGVALREFSAIIRLTILDATPPWVIWGTMLLASCYLVHNGLETMARLFDILFIGAISMGAFIAVSAIQQMELRNFLPILAHDPIQLGKGVIAALRAYQQFAIVGVILPHLRQKRSFVWRAVLAKGINVFIFTVAVFQCIAAFGPGETAYLVSPLLTLARSVDIPYSLVERLEAVLMTVWIPISFALISSHHYVIEVIFSQALGISARYRLATIVVTAVAIGLVAYLPRDILVAVRLSDLIDFVAMFAGLIFIPVTYLVAVLTGKRGD